MLFRFLILFFALPVSVWSQDTSDNVERKMALYVEIIGHNYLPYRDDLKVVGSLNFGYRLPPVKGLGVWLISLGWGLFSEEYRIPLPSQPDIKGRSWVNFVPLEVSLQIGRKRHFGEIGGGFVQAWGKHQIEYQGSHGSQEHRELSQGHQYFFRVGYTFYSELGMLMRLSYTKHFFDSYLNVYNYKNIYKADWIPIGVSIGYTF
jgi:hypothetical protein